jgi:hypothetical protein
MSSVTVYVGLDYSQIETKGTQDADRFLGTVRVPFVLQRRK